MGEESGGIRRGSVGDIAVERQAAISCLASLWIEVERV